MKFIKNKEDVLLCKLIACRAVKLSKKQGFKYPLLDMEMDISACHSNGCRLNLIELLLADDATFAHDVFGISRHLDRRTGRLTNCFVPRLAAKK